MRLSVTIACLVLTLGLTGCTGDTSKKVWLELRPVGEASHCLYADVQLIFHNDSDEDVAIYWWCTSESVAICMDTWLFFDIEKSDGTKLVYNMIGPLPKMPHRDDRKIIKPGEQYRERVYLTRFYAEPDRVSDQPGDLWPYRLWDKGEYKVRCVYVYNHNPNWIGGEGLWQGRLESNEITLKVDCLSVSPGVIEAPPGWYDNHDTN